MMVPLWRHWELLGILHDLMASISLVRLHVSHGIQNVANFFLAPHPSLSGERLRTKLAKTWHSKNMWYSHKHESNSNNEITVSCVYMVIELALRNCLCKRINNVLIHRTLSLHHDDRCKVLILFNIHMSSLTDLIYTAQNRSSEEEAGQEVKVQ